MVTVRVDTRWESGHGAVEPSAPEIDAVSARPAVRRATGGRSARGQHASTMWVQRSAGNRTATAWLVRSGAPAMPEPVDAATPMHGACRTGRLAEPGDGIGPTGRIRRRASAESIRRYSGAALPAATITKQSAEAALQAVQDWLAQLKSNHESRVGALKDLDQASPLRQRLVQVNARFRQLSTADHDDPAWPAAVTAQLAQLQADMGLVQSEWEAVAANTEWARWVIEAKQSEGTVYVDQKLGEAQDGMLRSLAGVPKGQSFPLQPQWSTAPIPIPASDPAVPEALRVLIRFISSENSAVGMAYPETNAAAHQKGAVPKSGAALPQETRGGHGEGQGRRGKRKFEEKTFGLTRSWHIDEPGNLAAGAPTPQAVEGARQGAGRAHEYVAANDADFALGVGVPEVVSNRSNLRSKGYVEFNVPQIGPNGRIVYEYVNNRFYFTPAHYQWWTCPDSQDKVTKLHPFFELTGVTNLLLTFEGTQELARLRYWEGQRRQDIKSL